ncbi:unnamed protein product [Camellia sinensis]
MLIVNLICKLFGWCLQVDITHWRRGEANIASVDVDGEFVASSSSGHKEYAKLHAVKAALEKLSHSNSEGLLYLDGCQWCC